MKRIFSKKERGFTLIELLVVVAIVGLLSSVILASLNSVRAKARDTQRKMELDQVSKSLYMYFDKYGRHPINMDGGSSNLPGNFAYVTQKLVEEGFLSKVPVSPCGLACDHNQGGYSLYNYGTGSYTILVTSLETMTATTTAIPPTCRPYANNWCSNTIANKNYCLCVPN